MTPKQAKRPAETLIFGGLKGVRAKAKTKHRFPPECPAFELLDLGDEIAEGTFNDQGSGLVLAFARVEQWSYGTPYFWSLPAEKDDRWRSAWHYNGRLRPLTRAAREMLAIAGVPPSEAHHRARSRAKTTKKGE